MDIEVLNNGVPGADWFDKALAPALKKGSGKPHRTKELLRLQPFGYLQFTGKIKGGWSDPRGCAEKLPPETPDFPHLQRIDDS